MEGRQQSLVYCLVINRNKPVGNCFYVEINRDADVGTLVEEVKKKRSNVLEHVDTADLTVWRCLDPKLSSKMTARRLANELSSIDFTNEDKVQELAVGQDVETLRLGNKEILLVQLPYASGLLEVEESRDIPSELTAVKRRDKALSTFNDSISVDNFDGVKNAHKRLFTGRMDDRYGHPVALFHQELALLQQRLQTLDAQAKTGRDWVSPRATMGCLDKPKELTQLQVARTYFDKFREFYLKETEQWLATQTFWEHIFGKEDMKVQKLSNDVSKESSGQRSKGVNRADAVWGKYAIFEGKNAPGLCGDPSLQAAVWYAKSRNSLKGICKHGKSPAILIGNMGNVLEVSIAVCLEEVVVDKILHFEILDSVHHDETIIKLALIASALKACADKLRDEYKDLEQTLAAGPVQEETWYLPCPSAVDPCPNASIPDVKFTGKLNRSNQELTKAEGKNSEMRSLFLAKYNDQEVVVKFSVGYCMDAHHAAANGTYAPKLHFCEQVIGGQQMIVMDRVNGKPMYEEPYQSLPCSVFEDLEKALKIIHDKGLVFGDLRDTNVMITESDGRTGAKLVDFDWADVEEKGRYPALINTTLIGTELDPDIVPAGLMYKKHDEYALRRLISKYCKDAAKESGD